MAGNPRVAMKMKQQDAAMKMKKDPMKMKKDPMKMKDPMDMKKDPMMMKKDPMMMKKDPMKMKKDPKRPVAEKIRDVEPRRKGRTVTKTKTRRIDGAKVTKTKGPGFREKSVMKMKKNSAMKMKKGSAMKKDDYDKALKKDPNLKKYIANRKTLTKGTAEFGINQHKINTAYYDKNTADKLYDKYRKKHNLGPSSNKEKQIKLNTKKLKKLDTIKESNRNVKLRQNEVTENFSKKSARKDKKDVRHSGGSKQEIAAADVKLEQAKLDDLTGAKGGRKGIFRGIREKLGKKRKKKSKDKAES